MVTEELVDTLENASTQTAVQADSQVGTSSTWTTDLALYEDGERIEMTEDTFEWWYFDTILDDGSTCVINFLNKVPFVSCPAPLPILQFNISPPTGQNYYQAEMLLDPASYRSARERCSVRMGPNQVDGDLRTYNLKVEGKDKKSEKELKAELTLEALVPGWRNGPYLGREEAAKQWLGEQIVIPSGTARGRLFYDGGWHNVSGTCYHDHQWGGVQKAATGGARITKWYWGRVRLGDHSVVFAQVFGSDGSSPEAPVASLFMLARGASVTYDDTLKALEVKQDGEGCHVKWTSNQGIVELDLRSPKEIADFGVPSYMRYLRYLSSANLKSTFAGETFTAHGKGIWEVNVFPSS
jgi:hypothetical protein